MKRFERFVLINCILLLLFIVSCTSTFFECQDKSKGVGLIINGTADDVLRIPLKYFYLDNEIIEWIKLSEASGISENQKKEINESLKESGRIHTNDVHKIVKNFNAAKRFKRSLADSLGGAGADITLTAGYDILKDKYFSKGKEMSQHYQLKDVMEVGNFKTYIQEEMIAVRQQKTDYLKRLLFSSDLSQIEMITEHFKTNNVGSWKIQGVTVTNDIVTIYVYVYYYSQAGSICFEHSIGTIIKNDTYRYNKTSLRINDIKVNKCEIGSFGVMICYQDFDHHHEEEAVYLDCCYHRTTKKHDIVVVDSNNYPECKNITSAHYKIYMQRKGIKTLDCTNFVPDKNYNA